MAAYIMEPSRSADGKNDFSSAGFHQTQPSGEIKPERLRHLDDRRDQTDAENARPLSEAVPGEVLVIRKACIQVLESTKVPVASGLGASLDPSEADPYSQSD